MGELWTAKETCLQIIITNGRILDQLYKCADTIYLTSQRESKDSYDVYIIDQAQGQDGWILAEFSFYVFMDRDEVEVHKNAKENEANTQPSWPN